MTDDEPKHVGDEFAEEVESDETNLENLYDLVLPPGVPHKVVLEAIAKFDLEVATRRFAVKTIDVEPDNLLVLRGELDAVNKAHDFIYKKLSEKYSYRKA